MRADHIVTLSEAHLGKILYLTTIEFLSNIELNVVEGNAAPANHHHSVISGILVVSLRMDSPLPMFLPGKITSEIVAFIVESYRWSKLCIQSESKPSIMYKDVKTFLFQTVL